MSQNNFFNGLLDKIFQLTSPASIKERIASLKKGKRTASRDGRLQSATSEQKPGDEDTVISLLTRVLLSVAIADGHVKAEETKTIKNRLVEMGADPSRVSKQVKACVDELRGGMKPRDFEADALERMKPYKNTTFGADVLRIQQAVANSDGDTSTSEQKVLDTFKSYLEGPPGNVEQNTSL